MDENKLAKLNKLLELVQQDTVSPKDIEAFLLLVLTTIQKSREGFETVSRDNLGKIKDALDYIKSEHTSILEKVDGKNSEILGKFESRLQEVTKLLAELKEIKQTPGKDGDPGKDADEDKIVSDVLAQIKIPEQFILEGSEIVSKVNSLELAEEYQIDAKHIKNLPTPKGGYSPTVLGNAVDLNQSARADGYAIVWDDTNKNFKFATFSGGLTTASNGLTAVGTDVQLGGTLDQTTTILGTIDVNRNLKTIWDIDGSLLGTPGLANIYTNSNTSVQTGFFVDGTLGSEQSSLFYTDGTNQTLGLANATDAGWFFLDGNLTTSVSATDVGAAMSYNDVAAGLSQGVSFGSSNATFFQTNTANTYDAVRFQLGSELAQMRIRSTSLGSTGMQWEMAPHYFNLTSEGNTSFKLNDTTGIIELRTPSELQLKTPALIATTATNGQVLTLLDATTGEADWADASGGLTQPQVLARTLGA